MDDLRLVKPVDGLGESIVVTVANAADGRLDPSFGKPLTVSNANVLRSPIGMVNQSATMKWPPIMQRLLSFLVSNCQWNDGKLTATFRQPFDILAEAVVMPIPTGTLVGNIPAKNGSWLGD